MIEEIQAVRMSPPPLEPHLNLSGQLPLQALFSAGLRTTKWTLSAH